MRGLPDSQSRNPGFSDEFNAHGFAPAPTQYGGIQPPLRYNQKTETLRQNDTRRNNSKCATDAKIAKLNVNHLLHVGRNNFSFFQHPLAKVLSFNFLRAHQHGTQTSHAIAERRDCIPPPAFDNQPRIPWVQLSGGRFTVFTGCITDESTFPFHSPINEKVNSRFHG
jgi:hypothetical protein